MRNNQHSHSVEADSEIIRKLPGVAYVTGKDDSTMTVFIKPFFVFRLKRKVLLVNGVALYSDGSSS